MSILTGLRWDACVLRPALFLSVQPAQEVEHVKRDPLQSDELEMSQQMGEVVGGEGEDDAGQEGGRLNDEC